MVNYLCNSKHQIEQLCFQKCCWLRQCGLQAGSHRSLGEATSPDSGRCHQIASLEHNCPVRPSTPDKAAQLWPAAPQGRHSDLRLTTETVCPGPRSETPHLENGHVKSVPSVTQHHPCCWTDVLQPTLNPEWFPRISLRLSESPFICPSHIHYIVHLQTHLFSGTQPQTHKYFTY